MRLLRYIEKLFALVWWRRRYFPPILLALLIVGLALSIHSTLRRTAWSGFSDGAGITRQVLDPDLRTVLWHEPETVAGDFNTVSNLLDPCFSSDESTMVFAHSSPANTGTNLFLCRWKDGKWTDLTEVEGVNRKKSNETAPFLSYDDKYLFFASDREGGFGGFDIWVAPWKNGKCGTATNLGGLVNTGFNETDPAVSADGSVLFFATDRNEGNFGERKADYDIYRARLRRPDTGEEEVDGGHAGIDYGKAGRLKAVCSPGNDVGPALTRHGDFLYFSSDRRDGEGGLDIYCARVLQGKVDTPQLIGSPINSVADERGASLRAEGFELFFTVNGKLRSAVMREVRSGIDYTRWHQLLRLLDRIKWWVLAAVGAAVLVLYLLRHWRDFTSLFQKCLIASIIVHLLLLLYMAGKFIAVEVRESSQMATMEVSIDADALAQEKMAMEMQEEVVELTPAEEDVVVEQVDHDVDIPDFEPPETKTEQPVLTGTSEDVFVADVTRAEPLEKLLPDAEHAAVEMAALPQMDMPEPEMKMEEAQTKTFKQETSTENAEEQRQEFQHKVETEFVDERVRTQHEAGPMEDVAVEPVSESEDMPMSIDTSVSESRRAVRERLESINSGRFTEMASLKAERPEMEMETPREYAKSESGEPSVDAAEVQQQPAAQEFAELAKSLISAFDLPLPDVENPVSNVITAASAPSVPASGMHEPRRLESARMNDGETEAPLSQLRMATELKVAESDVIMEMPVEYRDLPGEGISDAEPGSAVPETAASGFVEHERIAAAIAKQTEGTGDSPATIGRVDHGTAMTGAAGAPAAVEKTGSQRNVVEEENISDRFAKLPDNTETASFETGGGLEAPENYEHGAGTSEKTRAVFAVTASAVEPGFVEYARLSSEPPVDQGRDSVAGIENNKIPDSRHRGAVPSAGIESRGEPPEMRGVETEITTLYSSAMDETELKIEAPGKLDVPEAKGRIVSPVVLRRPGTLSTEIIEGLGGSDATQEAIASALNWFEKNQERDGHWDISKHGGEEGHDVAATGLILLCYYGWGATHTAEGPHRDVVTRALNWLIDEMQRDRQGRLTGRLTGKGGNMYDHAIATIALCEAYTLSQDHNLLAPARKAVDFIVDAQNPETGGWRYEPRKDSDILVTGWQYLALKSARLAGIEVDDAVFERADKWIDVCEEGERSGLYSYQPGYKHRSGTMIATGMFSRQLAGIPPREPGMKKSAAWLHTHPFKVKDLDVYYLYYGTLALYQHQGSKWNNWNEKMKKTLPGLQRKGMFNAGSWDPSGHLGPRMGRAVTTALCALSLEVYYRILPMYGFR